MNKRIEELAVQAGIISAEYNGFDSTGLTTSQRKFAELIVRECLLAISHTPIESDEIGTMVKCHNQVKQHFGVEE